MKPVGVFMDFTLATWGQSGGRNISKAGSLPASWTTPAAPTRQRGLAGCVGQPVSAVRGGRCAAPMPGLWRPPPAPRWVLFLGASARVSLSRWALGHLTPPPTPAPQVPSPAKAQVGGVHCSAGCQPPSPLLRGKHHQDLRSPNLRSAPRLSAISRDFRVSRPPPSSREGKPFPEVTFSRAQALFAVIHYLTSCSVGVFSSLIIL